MIIDILYNPEKPSDIFLMRAEPIHAIARLYAKVTATTRVCTCILLDPTFVPRQYPLDELEINPVFVGTINNGKTEVFRYRNHTHEDWLKDETDEIIVRFKDINPK